MNALHSTSIVLVIVGALNWGLIGITRLIGYGEGSGFDFVKWLFTDLLNVAIVTDIVYLVVGLAALVVLFGGMSRR